MEREDFRQLKADAIRKVILETAAKLEKAYSSIPRKDKNRDAFYKTYNRRPLMKRKKRMVYMQCFIWRYAGAMQAAVIMSQPIPRFKAGTSLEKLQHQ